MMGSWETYKSKSGKRSGVLAYKIGADRISVRFQNDSVYTYSYESCGKETVDEMKILAQKNRGLSTFISRQDPGFV